MLRKWEFQLNPISKWTFETFHLVDYTWYMLWYWLYFYLFHSTPKNWGKTENVYIDTVTEINKTQIKLTKIPEKDAS